MDRAPSILGLLGPSLLFVAGGVALLGEGRRRWWVAVLALLISLVPVDGLPIAGYVRGFTGDLSVTSLVVLVAGIFSRLFARKAPDGVRTLCLVAVIAGALLYPMALGLGPYDPYALGFRPTSLLVGAGVLALAAWWRGLALPLACLLAAVSAHALELMESRNLWDYLVDPWLWLFAIYELLPSRYPRAPREPFSTSRRTQ